MAKITMAPRASTASARTIAPSLGVGFVDRRADRRLDGEAEQTADGRHQADLGLAPVQLSDEEHVQIGPERAADIGEQEIDGVERARPEARRYDHTQSMPVTSVIMVSGAPTRK